MKILRGRKPHKAVPFTILSVSILLACFAFFSFKSVSAAPTTMNFQGRLADASGVTMPDGLYNMQFRLFTASSGGSATWTETRETTNRVQVTNGLFSVQLGSVTPLSASLFSGNDVYFEITLPTPATATCSTASCASWESAMTPRHKMATSAYAFQAENASTLDGLDSTAFAAATGAAGYINNTTSPQTADFAITGTGRIDTVLQAPSIQRNTNGTLLVGTTATTTGMTVGSTNLTGTLALDSGAASTITIGSSASARTINIGNVAAVQTITIGSTTTTSSTTIRGGATGNITLTTTGGAINLNSGTIATNATTANFLNTTSSTVNAFGAGTNITLGANTGTTTIRNSNVTVGNTTTRGTFTNNGATLNSTLALGDLAAGAIGTAAATVNIYTGVTISPTAGGRTYTVPSPTVATAGRTFYITNINATNSFTVLSQVVAPNTMVTLTWGGTAWAVSPVGGVSGANTSLSNLSAVNIGTTALNSTSNNLNLTTTTSGNIVLNSAATIELQDAVNVTGAIVGTSTIQGTQLISTITTGTAPLVVASTTKVTNLNADQLDGLDSTAFAGIALSNLSATSINQSLIANANNTLDIGSSANKWRTGYFGTSIVAPALRPVADSTTGLLIQNAAGSTTILTVDTSGSKIIIGSTTNGVTMSSTGLTLTGTARPDGSLVISPEYTGGTFTADGSNNNGSLSSDFCGNASFGSINSAMCASSSGGHQNYYQWTTDQATAQDYDLYVRFEMPRDFDSVTSFTVGGFVTSTTTDSVEVSIYNGDSQCGSTVDVATTNNTWTSGSLASNVTGCLVQGDMVVIKIKLTAGQNNFALVGDIDMQYKASR